MNYLWLVNMKLVYSHSVLNSGRLFLVGLKATEVFRIGFIWQSKLSRQRSKFAHYAAAAILLVVFIQLLDEHAKEATQFCHACLVLSHPVLCR